MRGALVANVVAHQSETVSEMQFKSSIFSDEYTPREVAARPPALFLKLEPKAVWEKNRVKNFGTIEKYIFRTKHLNHLAIF